MPKARKPSASQVATETLALLEAEADAKRATSYQRFFKEPVTWFGVENKRSMAIRADLIARVEEHWTIEDAVRFCKAMLKDPHMEARGTGFQVVAHFVGQAKPEFLADVRRWFEHACGNWGLVDNLAPSVLAPLLELHPQLVPDVVAWTESPNMWLRRAAAVAFVPLVGKGKKKHLDTAYKVAKRLFGDKEDLLHKAVGWLLREAGKADMPRLEKFLLTEGPRMPRTTVRYAIEKFSKEDRQRLLAATKVKKG